MKSARKSARAEYHPFDFSVSDNAVLAYQIGNPNSQLTWFDRTGKQLGTVGEPANYVHVALSPDERIKVGCGDALIEGLVANSSDKLQRPRHISPAFQGVATARW